MNSLTKGVLTAGLGAFMGVTMLVGPALADEDSEVRDVAQFNGIVIEGAMDIFVEAGRDQRVEVVTEPRYFSRVETRVDNGILYISQDGRRWHDTDLEVIISVENINSFILEGLADVEIVGINSETFLLEIDGAGDITLQGTCGAGEYVINGAGDVDAEDLHCRSVEIIINGAGDADVYASESVSAVLNGVGDITVCGDPDMVRPRIMGAGSFEVDDC